MDYNSIYVNAEGSGERIDALLARSLEDISRSEAQRLLEAGLVTLNGLPLKKNYKSSVGETYHVIIPEAADTQLYPQNIPLDIVFEDEDVILINKPRGMVVHPATGHEDETLVNALMYHCGQSLSGIGGERRPGIVHRIDKDTSGLIIAAKNDFSHRFLSAQLSDHSLWREYVAVVRGGMKEASGVVNKPIGRHPTDRKRMAVTEKASRNAITHWEVLARYKHYTLVKCRLETGRTHQIRVHMASIGHPLLGDGTYGAPCPEKGLTGQCLHARALSFVHPRSGERLHFETPLPEYFLKLIAKLGEIIE